MHRTAAVVSMLALLSVASADAVGGPRENQTVRQATIVLQEVMNTPGKGIPRQLLESAQAVAIVPQLKGGAFVVGIRKGRGVMTTRDANGQWQAPQFVTIAGGSVGWQAGVQSTDVVLVLRSRESLDNLMSGKLTIGADASVAAGPVGRKVSAATDVPLNSEIYSYSRSRGVFLGVSLDGSVLKPDPAADAAFYQASGGEAAAASAELLNAIAMYSGAAAGSGEWSTPVAVETTVPPVETTGPVLNAPVVNTPAGGALVASWQKLSVMLKPEWQQYLAVPVASATGDPVGYRAALATTLTRYDTVENDPRYRELTGMAEFHAVRVELMRALRESQPADPARLQLPAATGGVSVSPVPWPRLRGHENQHRRMILRRMPTRAWA